MDNNKTEDKSISRAEIHQIAWRVRDDEADPEEVRELLEHICTRKGKAYTGGWLLCHLAQTNDQGRREGS